jgi:hypothetical protein
MKTFRFFWAIVLYMGLVHLQAHAQTDSGNYGGIAWTLSNDGTLTFSGQGAIADFNKWNGDSPNTGDRPWQRYRQKVKKVVVKQGITRIGHRALQGFGKLKSAVLAESVRSVGQWAFQNCEQLEEVSLPKGIKLESGAFNNTPAEEDISAVESDEYSKSVYFYRLCGTRLTGRMREDVIYIAKSQLGYHEGNSEADYGGGNTRGNGDFSEYGRYLQSSGNAWCSEFGSWCVRMSGLPKHIMNSSRGANAATLTDDTPSAYYRWRDLSYAGGDYKPQQGDIILWAWDMDSHQYDESLGHTSILNRVVDNGNTVTLYTIDGNNGGCVAEETYTVRKSDGVLVKGKGRLYYLVAPDYENASIDRHRVTFVPCGGMVEYNMKMVASGGVYGPLPVPEKAGHKFLGWYTKPDGGKRVNIYTPVRKTTDESLFAHYE